MTDNKKKFKAHIQKVPRIFQYQPQYYWLYKRMDGMAALQKWSQTLKAPPFL